MITNKFPLLIKCLKFISANWVYFLLIFTLLNLTIYIIQRNKYQEMLKTNTSSASTKREIEMKVNSDINFYIIKYGDTLWDLAEKNYGSGFKYPEIIKNNPGKTFKFESGEQGLIYPGTEIIL